MNNKCINMRMMGGKINGAGEYKERMTRPLLSISLIKGIVYDAI